MPSGLVSIFVGVFVEDVLGYTVILYFNNGPRSMWRHRRCGLLHTRTNDTRVVICCITCSESRTSVNGKSVKKSSYSTRSKSKQIFNATDASKPTQTSNEI